MQSEYARHEMGHDPPELHRLPEKLSNFSTAFSVLAYETGADAAIGLINCFFGFSTLVSFIILKMFIHLVNSMLSILLF